MVSSENKQASFSTISPETGLQPLETKPCQSSAKAFQQK